MLKQSLFLLMVLAVAVFSACVDDKDVRPSYEIPTTYDFENVNYSGQTQRLAMLNELRTYIRTATTGQVLDADRLLAMYANDAARAGWAGAYEASKKLRDKTFPNEQAVFDAILTGAAAASAATVPAAEGQAGLITDAAGNRTYLVADNGLEYVQIVEKGLMGALLYYQAAAVYLSPDKMDVDNKDVTPGQGTAMEHHWDEAFGYLGVPVDFPTNTDGLFFWGAYSNQRNEALGSNRKIMDAFLKGRAAISNDDLETRDEAITEVRTIWERIAAASAIHYCNEALANFDDLATRLHVLSEGVGFIYALQFNPDKKLSNTEIGGLLDLLGGGRTFGAMNLYEVTISDIQTVRQRLADTYSMTNIMDRL